MSCRIASDSKCAAFLTPRALLTLVHVLMVSTVSLCIFWTDCSPCWTLPLGWFCQNISAIIPWMPLATGFRENSISTGHSRVSLRARPHCAIIPCRQSSPCHWRRRSSSLFCQYKVTSISVNSSFYTEWPCLSGGCSQHKEWSPINNHGFTVTVCIPMRTQNFPTSI